MPGSQNILQVNFSDIGKLFCWKNAWKCKGCPLAGRWLLGAENRLSQERVVAIFLDFQQLP